MMDFLIEHATGPVGGLVLLGVIVGVGSGWLFSRREVVSRDRARIVELTAEVAAVRQENAALYLRLIDAVRDPSGAAIRQLESVATSRAKMLT